MKAFSRILATTILTSGLLSPWTSYAARDALPADFELPPVTFGGAGGGTSREEVSGLTRCPVILIPDLLRDHNDWTGQNTDGTSEEAGDVYAALLHGGFQPVEIWMIDFAPAGLYMTSIEEATDDLKFFIAAVMRYTGANQVQLVAHGAGGILARLTLLKYSIAHWIAAEIYIDTPFRGLPQGAGYEGTLAGAPNAWALAPGSALLREILVYGETPRYPDPVLGIAFRIPTLTIRSGGAPTDTDKTTQVAPALRGAKNLVYEGLSHDALRCAPEPVKGYVAFLNRPAEPMPPEHDNDHDEYRGSQWGGPDLDDNDPEVYPGAPETPDDGIDQDCNGCDQASHGGREIEIPIKDL
jgi:hypothetical protein